MVKFYDLNMLDHELLVVIQHRYPPMSFAPCFKQYLISLSNPWPISYFQKYPAMYFQYLEEFCHNL